MRSSLALILGCLLALTIACSSQEGGNRTSSNAVPGSGGQDGNQVSDAGTGGSGGAPDTGTLVAAGGSGTGGFAVSTGGAIGTTGGGGSTEPVGTGATPIGNLGTARTKHVATLLANGKVLITGGTDGPYSSVALASAELYDPATHSFTATGSMHMARQGHTATRLTNGKVLIAGATDSNSAELYDPDSGTFTTTGNMIGARKEHTATLLASGKVLIAGGFAASSGLTSAELFDAASGAFTATGDLTEARYQHAAAAVGNQQVLLVGGYVPPTDTGNNDGLTSAELYDELTGKFSVTGSMSARRARPTATLLADSSVLVSGGSHGFEGYFASVALELFDPLTGKFVAAGNMSEARACHTATWLSNGLVLFTGGYQGGGAYGKYLGSTDRCSAGTCVSGTALTAEREFHTATLLADGSVLIAGGDAGGKALATAEIYR